MLEDLEVQVGAVGCRSQVVRDVGFADECGVAVDVGVQGDDFDGLTGLGRQSADGVDEPHRGLTSVHDGNAREHHRLPSLLELLVGSAPARRAKHETSLGAEHEAPRYGPHLRHARADRTVTANVRPRTIVSNRCATREYGGVTRRVGHWRKTTWAATHTDAPRGLCPRGASVVIGRISAGRSGRVP
ncbi:Uncharacterised protein [Mycobacteroides abscessus subsp. abscessus]|nr:Uncharacterised protein [Mycobacteroides abscessus subsp. abscessus]